MSFRTRIMTVLLVCTFCCPPLFAQEGDGFNLTIGDPFPDLRMAELLTPSDYEALGLNEQRSGPVKLSEIPGELLVLEFFNRYCNSCQRQAPFLQSYFDKVNSGDLGGKVRLVSVGIGNSAQGLMAFRRSLKANYPIVPDPHFDIYYALGDLGGTPYTFFLKRGENGWILADHHLGTQSELELLATTQTLLKGAAGPASRFTPPVGSPPGAKVAIDLEEAADHARTVLTRAAKGEVEVRQVEGSTGTLVFEALEGGKPLALYAIVAQRTPVCDLCHTILFALAFDEAGNVRGFLPIYVTKFGNEIWGESDEAHLSTRLVGQHMEGLTFDPSVDAVTSATMSSTLIFDEARRAAKLLETLKTR